MANSVIKGSEIRRDFSFSGTPDSVDEILTNCPTNYTPIGIVSDTATRNGWFYDFRYDYHKNQYYWYVRIHGDATISGEYSANIIAVKSQN